MGATENPLRASTYFCKPRDPLRCRSPYTIYQNWGFRTLTRGSKVVLLDSTGMISY